MSHNNCQKIKLLKLIELLYQETDEEHPLTTSQLCSRLAEMNITCDRRTLANDIQVLIEQGYEVESRYVGKSKGYFIADRSFTMAEIKLLIDTVQASHLITDKKTGELIRKLTALSGSRQAELLTRNMVYFNRCKHTNESIYYIIDTLERALRAKKKVTITYFHLNEQKKKVYRSENGIHTVEPIALVYNNDNYYLTCYHPASDRNYNYRLDRIEQVVIVDEPVSDKARIRSRSLFKYTAQVFKMYGGKQEKVTLLFEEKVIEYIYDKFGIDTVITRFDDSFTTTVEVQLSPTFWGWVFQFAGKMTVIAPKNAAQRYMELLTIQQDKQKEQMVKRHKI